MELEETVTTPAEAAESATEEVTTETTTNETEADALENEEGEGAEEFEEIEVNGKLYSVPKEIAPHVMKNADYTQKTQALAETRRQWEAQQAQERAQIEREREVDKAIFDDEAQKRFVDARLAELQQVNVYALAPQEQQRFMIENMQLRQAREDLDARITDKRSQLAAEIEMRTVNEQRQAIADLSKPDERLGWPGKYDQQTAVKLTLFGREIGLDDGFLASIRSPALVKALHLAQLGHETLKKQKAATVAPKPVANPVTQVGGARAKGAVDPDKMSIDQWMKWDTDRQRKAGRIR